MISRIKSAFDPDLEKERVSDSDAKLKELIRCTVSHFQDLVPDEMANSYKEGIREIFSDALNIQTTTMASKAIFIVNWPKNGDGENGNGKNDCTYDPATMEFFEPDIDTAVSHRTVELVESPALWKIGNEDGENFDSSMILYKHWVFPGQKKDDHVSEA